MTRDEAIARIAEGLGFRTDLNAVILRRLDERQLLAETGKTLPRFLLEEDAALVLPASTNFIALPEGFIRMKDDEGPHFTPTGESIPVFLTTGAYDATIQTYHETDERVPRTFIIRKDTIFFSPTPTAETAMVWSYWAHDTLPSELADGDSENAWLEHAPLWLIGDAGRSLAVDLRDKDAIATFTDLRDSGRDAMLRETFAQDEQAGPFIMGRNR